MKKIFAIALALVMVLSMASAFAANDCSTFDWTCPAKATSCGKAKVEVVPFVVVNDGCGGSKYEVSACATAIHDQDVFFAVKLTTEVNPDLDWFAEAELAIKATEVTTTVPTKVNKPFFNVAAMYGTDYKKSEEQVWYLMAKANGTNWAANAWVNAADENFDVQYAVWSGKVGDARKAKVCATLKSEHSGYDKLWTVGDYKVYATRTDAAGKAGIMTVTNEYGKKVELTWANGKVTTVHADSDALRLDVFAKLNLTGCGTGTCIDNDIIQKNLGWKDKIEHCFGWSDKGASVVNPECVVTLPKTGDASLLWWLF